MDPPLIINELSSSFSAANPSSYSLAEIWPFPIPSATSSSSSNDKQLGLRMSHFASAFIHNSSGLNNNNHQDSTFTGSPPPLRKRKDFFTSQQQQQQEENNNNNINININNNNNDDSSILLSTTTTNQLLMVDGSNNKRMKLSGSPIENGAVKPDVESTSVAGNKAAEQGSKPEPPKDYIHVRARRGQATDSHSLAERARREKISERMKLLQDLVPGCNKVIGKALVLDEIINYIQSLQRQVEFLSMKLETVNSRMSMTSTIEGYHSKESFDATRMIFGSQAPREYPQGSQAEWLHMQIGGSFERSA
ncbi:hypothetical protein ACFE04_028122 [Oxalis oulophora]